jgi:hypothetical protein
MESQLSSVNRKEDSCKLNSRRCVHYSPPPPSRGFSDFVHVYPVTPDVQCITLEGWTDVLYWVHDSQAAMAIMPRNIKAFTRHHPLVSNNQYVPIASLVMYIT